MNVALEDVRSDVAGFLALSRLAELLRDVRYEPIDVDMSRVQWFDANMCAPFGGILYQAGRALNTVRLVGLRREVEDIFAKNGFLWHYGLQARIDKYGTTVQYRRFEVNEPRGFAEYVAGYLVGHGLPMMSSVLRKRFEESLSEIFADAMVHSHTNHGIFSCGQYYPMRQRLDFSVTDLGIGIRQNLRETVDLELSAPDAIAWAVTKMHTTRRGAVPGGLGLKLLREFIHQNGGRLQIVSDAGFWEHSSDREFSRRLDVPFPGTTVNLEFDTADTKSYVLRSEIRPDDVF